MAESPAIRTDLPPAAAASGWLSGSTAALLHARPDAIGGLLAADLGSACRGLDVNALACSSSGLGPRCGHPRERRRGCGTSRTPRRPSRQVERGEAPRRASCSTRCRRRSITRGRARRGGHAPEIDVLPPQGTGRAALQPAGVVGQSPSSRAATREEGRPGWSPAPQRSDGHRRQRVQRRQHGDPGARPHGRQARPQGRDRARGARPLRRVVAARAPLAPPPALLPARRAGGLLAVGAATCATSRSAAGKGHALNLRAHFWSETAPLEELDLETLRRRRRRRLRRPGPDRGHRRPRDGRPAGAQLAELRAVDALVLLSPAVAVARAPGAAVARRAARARRCSRPSSSTGPATHEQIQRQNPDLTIDDVRRIQHLHGAESGDARRQMLAGVTCRARAAPGRAHARHRGGPRPACSPRSRAPDSPTGSGAEYQPFGAHSHYGLVIGERSHEQVADSDPLVPGAPSALSRSTIRVRPHLGPCGLVLSSPASSPHSSRGPGHRPLKAEIDRFESGMRYHAFSDAPGPRPGGVLPVRQGRATAVGRPCGQGRGQIGGRPPSAARTARRIIRKSSGAGFGETSEGWSPRDSGQSADH